MAKISAIVSAYFCKDYLLGRIDNLFTQDPSPEIVVVCQKGSAEHDLIIQTGPDIVLVLTDDVPTIYKAWNLGIEASTGEYITSANSDDRLYPGGLALMAQVLDKNLSIAVAYGNQDVVREVGSDPIGRFDWMEGNIEILLKGCFLGPMPLWRRSLHEKFGYFDEDLKVAGDYDFWLKLAKAKERFQKVEGTVGIYLDSPGSAEHRQINLTAWETARVRARYRNGVGIWALNI